MNNENKRWVMCICSHLYIYWNKTYLFHPISHLAILFCDMRWRIVMCLGVFALFLLACDSWSAESEVSEPVLWMRTASAVYHFSPFLFADPSVYYLKGWLLHGVVLLMCVGGMSCRCSRDVAESKNSRWVSNNVPNMMLKIISHLAIAAYPCQ